MSGSRARVVVAGLGDTGVLTAIHLGRHLDVVGIGSKPELVSGQELGLRLARPHDWARDYRLGFDRYRGLDQVRRVHGSLTGADLAGRRVLVRLADGRVVAEPYDVLVLATGVTNGFWRGPALESSDEVTAALARDHRRLAAARSIAVVGGGAAGVSSAFNLARRWPETTVTLYLPGERGLPHHHPGTWRRVARRLAAAGVIVRPGHRAVLPDEAALRTLGPATIAWTTGQAPVSADVVLWTVGRVRPNTAWLPDAVLDPDGFVRVDEHLRVPGCERVFAVGDVAATDPLRSSARNNGHRLVAHNVRAALDGGALRRYRPPSRRWGSVLGFQPEGLEVFAPSGHAFRFPAWTIGTVLQPLIVRRGIYRGVRGRR